MVFKHKYRKFGGSVSSGIKIEKDDLYDSNAEKINSMNEKSLTKELKKIIKIEKKN